MIGYPNKQTARQTENIGGENSVKQKQVFNEIDIFNLFIKFMLNFDMNV